MNNENNNQTNRKCSTDQIEDLNQNRNYLENLTDAN